MQVTQRPTSSATLNEEETAKNVDGDLSKAKRFASSCAFLAQNSSQEHLRKTKSFHGDLKLPPTLASSILSSKSSESLNPDKSPSEKKEKDAATPVVQVINVHKSYLLGLEGVPALRGVTFDVFPGEWVVIYGTSGGGKTSLLNIIGTIDRPTKGDIVIAGTHVTYRTPDSVLADLRLRHIGIVFQKYNLLATLTALENVELPLVLRATLSRCEARRLATTCLESVGMGHRLEHFPSQMSGGEQQRIAVARAMVNSPAVLLLDEPTHVDQKPSFLGKDSILTQDTCYRSGDLDTINTFRMMRLFQSINRNQGTSIVMVTHDLRLKHFASKVVYMCDGKVAKIEQVSQEERMAATADIELVLEKCRRAIICAEAQEPVPICVTRRISDYKNISEATLARALEMRAQYNKRANEDKKKDSKEDAKATKTD